MFIKIGESKYPQSFWQSLYHLNCYVNNFQTEYGKYATKGKRLYNPNVRKCSILYFLPMSFFKSEFQYMLVKKKIKISICASFSVNSANRITREKKARIQRTQICDIIRNP